MLLCHLPLFQLLLNLWLVLFPFSVGTPYSQPMTRSRSCLKLKCLYQLVLFCRFKMMFLWVLISFKKSLFCTSYWLAQDTGLLTFIVQSLYRHYINIYCGIILNFLIYWFFSWKLFTLPLASVNFIRKVQIIIFLWLNCRWSI